MSRTPTVIFPHLPKCGGTSVRRILEATDLRVLYDYDHPPSHRQWFRDQCERRNQEFSVLDFSPLDVVFGHFPLARYRDDRYLRVTLMRHPVDRVVSQFFYYKNGVPEDNHILLARNPVIGDVKAGILDIAEFARKERQGSMYERYLGDASPDSFALVGFTDDHTGFVNRLGELLGVSLDAAYHERRGTKDQISDNERRAVEAALGPDLAIYQRFRHRWYVPSAPTP